VTVIARALVDGQGALLRGELADVDGQLIVRFVGTDGLRDAINSFLTSKAKKHGQENR